MAAPSYGGPAAPDRGDLVQLSGRGTNIDDLERP